MANDPLYETIIGLEVHAQMLTRSKIFCGCSTTFGAEANTQICPVCAAFPGVLPVLNRELVQMAIKTGLAVHGTIRERSEFARKNYFYPDLPAGYQISQFELPIIERGELTLDLESGEKKRIGITRIHMEVDAGKSLHEGIQGASWIDLNRTGTPLLEIVSEPDLRSSREAGAYLKKLRSILRYLQVCDGNMEEGSFRCDANVSVRRRGDTRLGTRTELKNLNSIRNVMRAIDFEADRQIDLLESGGTIVQETRLWDANLNTSRSMRGKEEAHDYRYFPEPDLPPLVITRERIDAVARQLPELPDAKAIRFSRELGLSEYDAGVLTSSREMASFFEETVQQGAHPKTAANWITVELLGRLNREGLEIEQSAVTPRRLGRLIGLIQSGDISGKIAKQVFELMFETEADPERIVAERGLKQVSDTGAIEAAVDKVLAENPTQVQQYREGKTKVAGFLVGQVMKATRGKANPAAVNAILQAKLSG
ncbi:MAG: Asp-tRNA(Asn)/Glu-tRNA(Gln) amidotransferase subunit GatB [Magnetococcales bacterium]|nr:Asp-tRNA(Asn)/Glu-tRNA(Gln) amidotransferase subunit GatB [Magnetococcales bacterium]MBF0151284.1 Asp-tRNA(Asn)/Glu-tRNA(Gln) amidotransferase subunit GatB [Magnetococcales bacterium]MBF0174862.1 Asp-tRNA(Asn)/Glu-tRNA(Gln) amidotransferase subunit GatB [Magnetococcales bacterium]MBF0631628.1 Asp-tRNA(Asn)/Glu-tRNA(Gln) amidotransferase subunit GatB [Magnetococcales bacterium]